MTVAQFRKIAMSLPEAVERTHMNHPDFRVKGKIFATLFTRDNTEWGMAKLKPEQQRLFIHEYPGCFEPCSGAWGRQGCTQIRLAKIGKKESPIVRSALLAAWFNAAPSSLLDGKKSSD